MVDCIFCKIAAKEIQSKIAYEDEEVVAFHDINPQAPIHVLIIPRKHIPSLNDATEEEQTLLGKLMLVAQKLAKELGVAGDGYRLVLNTNRGAGLSLIH
ncbi:MAG: histidine triad nucleotide-binding protein, partial [Armatimonadetes bacterium]|nr:histidine triad nucleotide-binding protein [Armatimonadota bacterium]